MRIDVRKKILVLSPNFEEIGEYVEALEQKYRIDRKSFEKVDVYLELGELAAMVEDYSGVVVDQLAASDKSEWNDELLEPLEELASTSCFPIVILESQTRYQSHSPSNAFYANTNMYSPDQVKSLFEGMFHVYRSLSS